MSCNVSGSPPSSSTLGALARLEELGALDRGTGRGDRRSALLGDPGAPGARPRRPSPTDLGGALEEVLDPGALDLDLGSFGGFPPQLRGGVLLCCCCPMKQAKRSPAVRSRPAKATATTKRSAPKATATKATATAPKATATKIAPRVLVTTSLKIGEDQREALRDLAREEQRAGHRARFDLSALVREAIDRLLADRLGAA